MSARILVVDDEAAVLQALTTLLCRGGYRTAHARNGEEAVQQLENDSFDLVISDVVMTPVDGIGVLRAVQRLQPGVGVILMTGKATLETARQAKEMGAFDYVPKPFRFRQLLQTVQRALAAREQPLADGGGEAAEASDGEEEEYRLARMVAESRRMQRVLRSLERVAQTADSVLFEGEAGTGRTTLARCLHHASPRAHGRFVMVDGGTPPPGPEAQLFAEQDSAWHHAHGGTIYLHDVHRLPGNLQHKLNHFLAEGAMIRAADSSRQPANCRLAASCQGSLEALTAARHFLPELCYRLTGAVIELPPLRERPEDIPMLIRHFLMQAHGGEERTVMIEPRAVRALQAHAWPGNLAELRDLVRHAAARGSLDLEELPEPIRNQDAAAGVGSQERAVDRFIRQQERARLRRALDRAGGDIARGADSVGMDVREFWQRLTETPS